MNLTLESLPNKFLPFLLGHKSCTAPENCKSEIDEIFSRSIENAQSIKSDYVKDGGNWVIKGDRTDALAVALRPDTNIYRVRKANKIRNFIRENNLEQHVMVPQKFIYWDANSQKFFVVSEKVALSEEVATPASNNLKIELMKVSHLGGQALALSQNKPERALTPEQAETLAKLSFIGYTDLTYNNMYFTDEGKVAIIDTEPLKRSIKKGASENPLPWITDKDTWVMQQSLAGTSKLKLSCSDPLALEAVEKVEKENLLWGLAKLVGKIALAVFVICALSLLIPQLAVLVAIPAAAVTILKVTLIGLATFKLMGLALSVLNVSVIWGLSQMAECGGLPALCQMESQGAC